MTFGKGLMSAAGLRVVVLSASFALGVSGVCAPLLFGQASTQVSAQELAARVDRHYDQLHSLKAGFEEDYAGLGMTRTETGTLFLRKPGQMLWRYTTPAGKIFLLDGKFAWLYTQGDAQVQRISAKELDDLRSPLRFLLGHTELEKELSGLKIVAAANGNYTLSGVPKGHEDRVTRLSLTVNAAGAIAAIEIVEVDGATTRFTFTDQQSDAPIPAGTFHFTPPPGVPVVDAMPPV
jgi:outer membrane lipoprotein carrier protein